MVIIMLNKAEAKALVEEFNIQAEKIKKAEVFDFCNNDIAKAIEEVARQGKESIKISIPNVSIIDLIIHYLICNDYAVLRLTHNCIMIEW